MVAAAAAAAEWNAHTLDTTRVKQSSSSTGWRGSAPLQLLHGLLAKNMTAGWESAFRRHQKAFRLPAAECRQSVGTPTPLRLHTYIQQNPPLPVGLPQSGDLSGDSLRIIPTASQSHSYTSPPVARFSICCQETCDRQTDGGDGPRGSAAPLRINKSI